MPRTPRCRSRALATLLALCFAAPAFAQIGEEREMASFTVSGPVISVDTEKNTITIGGDTGGTFEVDPDASLSSGTKKLTLGEFAPGWYVEGNGDVRGATNPKKVITFLEEVDKSE